MIRLEILFLGFLALTKNEILAQLDEVDITFEPLTPKGFKAWIPDQPGIRLFAFHGNLNVPFDGRESGMYSKDITKAKNGRWTFVDRSIPLQPGNTIYYWLHVEYYDGTLTRGYLFEGSYTAEEGDFVEDTSPDEADFNIPSITIEPLNPRGLRASIQHEPGIKLFAFHCNINKPLNGREAGDHAKDIVRQQNNRWTFLDRSIRLRKGDTIYYWYYVLHAANNSENLGYAKYDQSFKVINLIYDEPSATTERTTPARTTRPPKTTTSRPGCDPTVTKINGGKKTCKGKLIFQDQFGNIAPARWETEIKYADEPDYEFVSYSNNPEVIYAKRNTLFIKPKLADEIYGPNYVTSNREVNLGINCTGTAGTPECVQKSQFFLILPPVVSGRINTSPHISFKYGIVEIRAKLPKGDWIYPELMLTPKEYEYGPGYQSGEIKIAFSPGNANDGSKLWGGIIFGHKPQARSYGMRILEGSRKIWNDDFHVFSMKWSPDSVKVFVDDEIYGNIEAPVGGFASEEENLELEGTNLWKEGTTFAPFDQEMVLTIGVGVGGYMFPDQPSKPWKNSDPKSQRRFYEAKNQWKNTWNQDSMLQVDYVKIWAL